MASQRSASRAIPPASPRNVEHVHAPSQLSLRDMARLVLACALASLSITPSFRALQYGAAGDLSTLVIADSVVVFLVWALCAFVLVKRGPRRTALVEWLLIWPAAVSLGAVLWVWSRLGRRFVPRGFALVMPADMPLIVAAVVAVLCLASISLILAVRLVRRLRAWLTAGRHSTTRPGAA